MKRNPCPHCQIEVPTIVISPQDARGIAVNVFNCGECHKMVGIAAAPTEPTDTDYIVRTWNELVEEMSA